MFLDETRVSQFYTFFRQARWPLNGRHNPCFTIPSVKNAPKVMARAAICAGGRGRLWFMPQGETIKRTRNSANENPTIYGDQAVCVLRAWWSTVPPNRSSKWMANQFWVWDLGSIAKKPVASEPNRASLSYSETESNYSQSNIFIGVEKWHQRSLDHGITTEFVREIEFIPNRINAVIHNKGLPTRCWFCKHRLMFISNNIKSEFWIDINF